MTGTLFRIWSLILPLMKRPKYGMLVLQQHLPRLYCDYGAVPSSAQSKNDVHFVVSSLTSLSVDP
jgi:hypothetical protein